MADAATTAIPEVLVITPKPPKPDALRVPNTMVDGDGQYERIMFLKELCAPLLGTATVKIANQVVFYFVYPPGPDLHLQFQALGTRHGQSRYRWELQPSGIDFGYFVEGGSDASA